MNILVASSYMDTLNLPDWIVIGLSALLLIAVIIGAVKSIHKDSEPMISSVIKRVNSRKVLDKTIIEDDQMIKDLKTQQDLDREASVEADNRISGRLDNVENKLDDTLDMVVQDRLDAMAQTITDFASACANKRVYTKEQYRYIFRIHKDYESLRKKYNLNVDDEDDEVQISMKIIYKSFEYLNEIQGFLENRPGVIDLGHTTSDSSPPH